MLLMYSRLQIDDHLFVHRLKWVSGQAFQGLYDAAPTPANASQFLRINGIDLVINCKRCAPDAEALSINSSIGVGAADLDRWPAGVAVRAAYASS